MIRGQAASDLFCCFRGLHSPKLRVSCRSDQRDGHQASRSWLPAAPKAVQRPQESFATPRALSGHRLAIRPPCVQSSRPVRCMLASMGHARNLTSPLKSRTAPEMNKSYERLGSDRRHARRQLSGRPASRTEDRILKRGMLRGMLAARWQHRT